MGSRSSSTHRRNRVARVVVAAAATALLACASAGASPASHTFVDKAGGFRVTLPNDWEYVPSSATAVEAYVKKFDREKNTALARIYASIIATAAGRSALKSFAFQAFVYPPASPLESEFLVQIIRTTTTYRRANLPSVGTAFAHELGMTSGSKIDKPKVITLPAGAAAFVEGTAPAGGGVTGGFELYLVPHGKLLYELSFHSDVAALKGTVFATIARTFAF